MHPDVIALLFPGGPPSWLDLEDPDAVVDEFDPGPGTDGPIGASPAFMEAIRTALAGMLPAASRVRPGGEPAAGGQP